DRHALSLRAQPSWLHACRLHAQPKSRSNDPVDAAGSMGWTQAHKLVEERRLWRHFGSRDELGFMGGRLGRGARAGCVESLVVSDGGESGGYGLDGPRDTIDP